MKKTWDVNGIIWATDRNGNNVPVFTTLDMCPIFAPLVVRYTSDAVGKSLSISDDVHGLMLEVPFDAIEKELTGGRNK